MLKSKMRYAKKYFSEVQQMNTLKFNLSSNGNKFKILHATNGGPWHKRHAEDQFRSNMEDYKALKIPYSRNHDSAACGVYGGPHSHDITQIFPDFNANPYMPDSYDFACTDESILVCLEAGTQTFFRLGQTIEHQIKKHETFPPADFKKWAVVCEHIIRHYNEGWADGYRLNIKYWEIWNEADLDPDDSTNKRTWGGTKAQFFELYETAAKHLKTCFPDLLIGGPALAYREDWAEDFLSYMSSHQVPIDFFSWHIYCTEPAPMVWKAEYVHKLLEKYGYGNAQNILNEWNYVKGWTDQYLYSMKAIHSMKGAAFMLACMCAAQHSYIDMLMYYDTRPSTFNGVFDFYTYEPLKGYFALAWYSVMYSLEKEIPAENSQEHVYSLCGTDKDGKAVCLLTYYDDNDTAEDIDIAVDFGRKARYEVFLLDDTHNAEKICETEKTEFHMKNCSALLIKEI